MSVRPIIVANASFTLDANARDCPPLQFVREFTVNAVEAISARRGAGHPDPADGHKVIWRQYTELSAQLVVPKLACIDTGIGMTADELDRYIRALASSSKRQALDGNYGWGAKISAAERNPAGLTYLSFTGTRDSGRACTLILDAEQGWGLAENDRGELFTAVPDELCPPEIAAAGWRGTAVIFMGRDLDDNTTVPPAADLGVDWLLRAVNTRFLELPDDIDVRCQRPGDTFSRRARGQAALLDECTEKSDILRLTDATVHWRILDDKHDRRKKDGGRWASTGHRAALHQGELYELRSASAGGYRKLQEFGIHFGYQRVVLYVEPDNAGPDNTRARLLRADPVDKQLPWERWADEFTANMPGPIAELVAKAAGNAASRDRRDIMRRLQEIAHIMPLPVWKADEHASEHAVPTHGGHEHGVRPAHRHQSAPGTSDGPAHGGELIGLFSRPDGPAAAAVDWSIPDIECVWVSTADGSRVAPVMDDRAATFLQRHAMVQLNADFRGYQVLLDYFRGRYGHLNVDQVVVAEVRAACEDLAVEYIVGILRLRCQPYWLSADEQHALDERSLTGALMTHATIASRVEERLNRRLAVKAAA
jgi:hypothetical protein